MRDYSSGKWGFGLIWGLRASVFPRAFVLALPNAALAFSLASVLEPMDSDQDDTKNAMGLWAGFTSVLFFVLYFRSNVAYSRWWEGGTLLQQVRGEWFNAYSSLIAFSSTDPKKADDVEQFHHMLARFMSLLFCSALQQVSPDRDRAFETIDLEGIDPDSMSFLSKATDKVEVILQWIQRSTIINMGTGVLPIPPPVMSRAFQELSRGIVNLQNARKIADFPFPFPYAQTSIVMIMIHYALCPVVSAMLLDRVLAGVTSFAVIFFLWCINYIALELESPFGDADNDLPMQQMQADWNKSLGTLLAHRAQTPPKFEFDPSHRALGMSIPGRRKSASLRRLTLPPDSIPDVSGAFKEADVVPGCDKDSTSKNRCSNNSYYGLGRASLLTLSSRASLSTMEGKSRGGTLEFESSGSPQSQGVTPRASQQMIHCASIQTSRSKMEDVLEDIAEDAECSQEAMQVFCESQPSTPLTPTRAQQKKTPLQERRLRYISPLQAKDTASTSSTTADSSNPSRDVLVPPPPTDDVGKQDPASGSGLCLSAGSVSIYARESDSKPEFTPLAKDPQSWTRESESPSWRRAI